MLLRFLKNSICFLVLTLTYLLLTTSSLAADFASDYNIDYYLSEKENKLSTQVKFTVAITNFRTDVYVKQFSIGFPETFTIRNIKASDDHGSLKPEIETTKDLTKISLEFSYPSVGKNSKGNFYLEFTQDNLFTVNGNVWEVIVPTVENKQNGNYNISVHLPPGSNKKISISKPKPTSVNGNVITWKNPPTKTVYAVFGDSQIYQTNLTYNLKNEKLIPVYTDIALPPDTLYQKIYAEQIKPEPAKVFTDSDGNFLARYFLGPKEAKTILFNGQVVVFSKPREEFIEKTRSDFAVQKQYLLSDKKYWELEKAKVPANLVSNAKNIFDFVVTKLSYNYAKISTDNKRLGAATVLENSANAVCMEYTDLFIALAREKGIPAREIEGYGFSQDPKLRPISLVSDILHSWPEYYNTESQLWTQIDPTWEDTSGIDYFSSFDLNHIAFAIHGKDSEYPYPAGTYKIEDSRDVEIAATNEVPQDQVSLLVNNTTPPAKITDNRTYKMKIELTNNGNVYLDGKSVPIEITNLQVTPQQLQIGNLAPFEKKTLEFSYRSNVKNLKGTGSFNIQLPTGKLIQANFSIVPFYYELSLMVALVLSFFAGVTFLLILLRRTRKYAN